MLREVQLADKRHIIFHGLEKKQQCDILMLESEKSHYSVIPSNISMNVAILAF